MDKEAHILYILFEQSPKERERESMQRGGKRIVGGNNDSHKEGVGSGGWCWKMQALRNS